MGLTEGIGEKVACLVVPDDEYDIALSRADMHRLIEEHFREVSASLPYFKRVKVLHFTDIELPRTATRKVKRREVVQNNGSHLNRIRNQVEALAMNPSTKIRCG